MNIYLFGTRIINLSIIFFIDKYLFVVNKCSVSTIQTNSY